MQHIISNHKIHLTAQHSYRTSNSRATISLINRFSAWCEAQENKRFLWLGVALMVGIGTILPVTLSAIAFVGGNSLVLWIAACVFNVPILVVNLAAIPTKVTLPVLFFAWTVNAVLIAYCILQLFVK